MQFNLLPTEFEYATAQQIAWHHARDNIIESDWAEAKQLCEKWNKQRQEKNLEIWR